MTRRKAIPQDVDTLNPAPVPCIESEHVWVESVGLDIEHCSVCGRLKVT